ncbi:hypoxanthine phosphoribosyltransferase [Borrelia miyamotoi]|uniref:Hypoxanthine phosphoribosyltransferase n=1 Tax=Borrelia miyamotoi TaxID=47466 RepID=Q6QNU0_9SPIR|nr:hypoxanthine phosphoribosyltransferase [Borrelia miyamotoi]AAS02076.1 hypoxanthine-guanine phosphoribosyltransferase [Borrelia miyamotoi]AGT27397.1 hypoxanthine phosphoribosyltransferase [Borrelia miyamotoi LB-2001]AJA58576.1 hypoxanthine phosphoribosyltransferase [Borrelia miyamotoi]AOW95655.1 hypoxanthine phosphoribosyltransferase [Borrelia miyamotoi]QTL83540.1 hypoxanthine phosphoribosyltransferase [Borrelia miyamotoi]
MNYEISTLFTEEKIRNKIQKLAQKIRNYYKDKNNVVFISILKGSFMFFADITREIGLNVKIDFLHVSSYNNKTHSSSKVLIKKDIDVNIENSYVILFDDIIDTGLTYKKIIEHLKSKNPKEIKICTLFNKPSRRLTKLKIDYIGFEIANYFVVGYGIDFNEKHRTLKNVAKINK